MCGRGRDGFTLLEAVVALVVLGMAGAAALSALASELRTAARVNEALPAVALARDRVSAIRLLSAEAVAHLPDSLGRGVFEPPFDTYRWEASARVVRDRPDLFDVNVTVEWDTGRYSIWTRLYRPMSLLRALASPGGGVP
jgi:prepilin-type N-terminal cleavage/methylation domain-containing protein